jgi:hypothetical protein
MWFRAGVLLSIVALAGCSVSAHFGDASAHFGDAKNATDLFHRRVDGGEYAVIYDTAGEDFKAGMARDKAIAFLAKASRKMGKCEAAAADVAASRVTLFSTVIITMSSRSCANGKLEEQFAWQMIGGKARLFKYKAINPLLLTD